MSKELLVKITVSKEFKVPFNSNNYGDMTLEEAVAYEKENEDTVISLLEGDLTDLNIGISVAVQEAPDD